MNDSPWLPFNQVNSSIPRRLFCFPYAGGNPQFYRAWQKGMPNDVEVFPVQLPGRGIRFAEESMKDIKILIPQLVQALLPYMDRPFSFFGHSMGALISFELTRYLRNNHGFQPQHLLVSGYHAPYLPDPDPPIHHLPDEEFIAKVILMNGIPEEIIAKKEFLELFLPLLRADFTLCEQYQYQEEQKLSCAITAFGGEKDAEAEQEHLEAWQECTIGSFDLVMFPGNHFFIHEHEAQVLETISSCLQQKIIQSK